MVDSICDNYKDELSALLDNQVGGSLKTEVESHLEACSECAAEFDSLKAVSKLIGQAFVADSEIPDIWSKIALDMPSVCDVIVDDLSAYLDGELTSPAQEGVNQHLKDCADCLAKFTALNQTNRLLAKGLELPQNVQVNLWSSIKERLTADCALIDNELSAYLDQEVVTLRHREITKHLTDCSNCQVEFGKLTNIGDVIRDSYKPNIPDDFDLWPGIKSKLQVVPFTPKTQTASSSKVKGVKGIIDRRVYALAAVAAVFVLVFGLGAFWLNSPEQSNIRQVSAEGYLIDSSLLQPADKAEAVVYEE
ncbi:zf-HC2 domain-containing protein [bacterium]|nr:zf-HC2 domain-containing protein [bacterium]MBP9808416.1 zf-HC2 domain-containing protein [bacterium]